MNAVRQLSPADIERVTLRDQLDIAHQRLDAARLVSVEEYEFWLNRVKELKYQLYGNTMSHVRMSYDDRIQYGGREEEREGASNGAINWEA